MTTTAVNPANVDVTKIGYQNSLDLTNSIISTDIPGVQALGSGTRFYTDGDQLMLIYLNYPINDVPLAQEVFNNKEYLQNLTYEATNTREINGQLTLTNDSIITVHVPAQTVSVSIPDGLYKVPYGEWVLYGTDFSPDSVDESGNHPLSGDMNALVSQTTVSSRFPAGPSTTANGTNSVTIPAGDYQYSMSGI